MKKFLSKLAPVLVVIVILQTFPNFTAIPALADTATTTTSNLQGQIDTDNQQIADLNQKIAEYQKEISQAGADKKTLQSALNALDLQRSTVQAQVAVTQNQINSTQLQIQQLGNQISDTTQSISTNQQALTTYIQNIHQSDDQPLLVQLISSASLSGFWQVHDETEQVQSAVQEKNQELQTEQTTLTTTQAAVQQQADILSTQNKSLTSQQQSLNASVAAKTQLIAATNSKEASYQKLLAQAQAQLQSFSNFTKNAGGDKLLKNQTVCDDWGCYFNQRDAAWGAQPLDGTQYSMASDGCLVTAMAMVMTHYGYSDVTPETINANSTNFAAYYPAYLLTTINADGVTATRKTATIDATLAGGDPVVIGMNAYGGTHFVVLISGSNGNYIMRDPYVANGKDIKFSSYYSMKEIYSIAKVVIGS